VGHLRDGLGGVEAPHRDAVPAGEEEREHHAAPLLLVAPRAQPVQGGPPGLALLLQLRQRQLPPEDPVLQAAEVVLPGQAVPQGHVALRAPLPHLLQRHLLEGGVLRRHHGRILERVEPLDRHTVQAVEEEVQQLAVPLVLVRTEPELAKRDVPLPALLLQLRNR